MKYELKDCVTGKEEKERKTTVEISEKDGILTFAFTAENSKYYCPFHGEYNKIHAEGDVCEVFIGSHEERKEYYEMEITPKGDLMLAKMTYHGEGGDGPIMELNFVETPFVQTHVERTDKGYTAVFSVSLFRFLFIFYFFNTFLHQLRFPQAGHFKYLVVPKCIALRACL